MDQMRQSSTSISEEEEGGEGEEEVEEVKDANHQEQTGEEGEEEGEEEEEEEPKLKYQRLGANVQELLKKEPASCMVVHEKFLVRLSTHFLLLDRV